MITIKNISLYFKRKNLFLICILLLFSNANFFSQSNSYKWVQTASPIYSDLHSVYMFSPNTGVAAGKQILIRKNNKWIEMRKQPPIKITSVFAIDTSSIFAYSSNSYQESELYYWNGEKWNKIYHPIVNNILSIYFKNELFGVIGGVGEIAVFNNHKWKFLPPIINTSIISILIDNDSTFWALSGENILYKFKKNWKQINYSKPVQEIKMLNNQMYVIGNDFFGKIVSDTIKKISFNKKLKKTTTFSIINNKEVFAIGRKGLILHYFNDKWIQEKISLKEDLNSIYMLNPETGWIVGDNGTLLNYTNIDTKQKKTSYWKGFKIKKLKSNAKLIDDEYGVVAADFNHDGLVDIFTCGLFETNHLYINTGNYNFKDEYIKYGFKTLSDNKTHRLNLGVSAGDFDNDGDIDLYVSCLNGTNKVYKYMHYNSFIDYSSISLGIGADKDRTNSVIFGDVDNDGDLDLFITNEYSSNRLYLNNGVGIFKDVTESVGLISQNGGMSCSFGDIDNDGDIDLYVANWYGENKLYKNLFKEERKLYFQDITRKANVQGAFYTKSNGVVFADIDNDADLDLFISNRKSSNKLYINDGYGNFSDKTNEFLGCDSFKTNGVLIADFDGDGYKDIYLSNVGENVFYKNDKGKFKIVSSKYDTDISGYSTGSAYADFDNDGDLDIYVANYVGESSTILINNLNNNNFIKLHFNCLKNNRSGIGSKIYVFKNNGLNDLSQLMDFRQLTSGSGYASMNETNPTIQIQDNDSVDIKIVFPTGQVKIFEQVNQGTKLIVSDIEGLKRYTVLTKQYILGQILDPHKLFELIKWIFILLIIALFIKFGFKRYNWSINLMISIALSLFFLYFMQYYYLEYNIFMLSTILPFVSTIGLIFLLFQYFERRYFKSAAIIEKEQIREKLSRDLHDNLASTISSIGIYLTLIRYKIGDNNRKINELLQKSESLVSDAATSITDLVWTIKPKPENLSNLITRINNNFSELFLENNINYHTSINTNTEKILLKPVIKQNIYLIIKEALNNILKHAKAKNVNIIIEEKNKNIKIIIKDDGVGFDYNTIKGKGHGLNNMVERADDIKADFKISSVVGKGTIYELIFQD